MDVLWDPAKEEANRKKHGVRFSDAELVLFDPNALTIEEQDVDGEQRFVTIGLDSLARAIVIVYAYRDDHIRMISARRATRREIHTYEKGI